MAMETPQKRDNEQFLDSWKEIGAHLQRDVSTVMRWEKSEGLPVRRQQHSSRASVYAYRSELDAWRSARKPKSDEMPQLPVLGRLLPALAGGSAMIAVAAVVLWGPIMNPPDPPAAAANGGDGASAKQVWTISGRFPFRGSIFNDGRFFYTSKGPKVNLLARDLVAGKESTSGRRSS